MAKEVARKPDLETLLASDVDRHKIAGELKSALDVGRLSLMEYDDRVRLAYGARTYSDLLVLVADLPHPGLSAEEITARQVSDERRAARKVPMALLVLWTIYGSLVAINIAIWFLVSVTTDGDTYPWPIWLLVPGAALAATTVGVQGIRRRHRRLG